MDGPWRLLPYHVGDSDRHFALSDALVREAHVPTIWWHSTEHPTVILGPRQRSTEIDAALCQRRGVRTVYRQAGGTAVLAGPGVLGMDAVLPAHHPLAPDDVVEAYRWLGETWLATLLAMGAGAHLVSVQEARAAPRPAGLGAACFGSLSPYEITVGGRKLVGLAQVRRGSGVSIASCVHLRFDAHFLADLLRSDPLELDRAAIGLHDAVPGNPDVDDVMAAFHTQLARRGIDLGAGAWTAGELDRAGITESALV